jgi:thymidylate kinase
MIICLEGINGCGKSTLAAAIAERWGALGKGRPLLADVIRDTSFGRQVRTAIMNATELDVDAESCAFVSARLHGAAQLRRAAEAGQNDLIVLERWSGAVVAYGTAVAVSPRLLDALESVLAAALPVDRTFLVDVPGAVAARRLAEQTDTNRFEARAPEYLEQARLEQVRQEYLSWANARGIPVISGMLPGPELSAKAADTVAATTRTTTRS